RLLAPLGGLLEAPQSLLAVSEVEVGLPEPEIGREVVGVLVDEVGLVGDAVPSHDPLQPDLAPVNGLLPAAVACCDLAKAEVRIGPFGLSRHGLLVAGRCSL